MPQRHHTIAGVIALASAATAAALSPEWRCAVCVLVLAWLAWSHPEVILALFLTAGAFKSNSFLASSFPADATLVLAFAVLFAIARGMRRKAPHLPYASILLLPVLLLTGLGAWGPAGEYGTQKALRFVTLTALAMLGCMTLLTSKRAFTVFLLSLTGVAVGVTVSAALGQQTDSTARLRLDGTSPITLARMSVITFTACWLGLRLAVVRWKWVLLPVLALVSIYVITATGSRGPVLSLLLGFAILEFFARRKHGLALLPIRWVPAIIAVVALLVISGVIPTDPLLRFEHALTLQGDRSISQRMDLYRSAWMLMKQHPFGIGVGGFADHAILDLRYPHNVFLEAGVELGWVPMLLLLALSAWSLWVLLGILTRSLHWTSCLLAMVVLMSGINAMVTGDFNDNRLFFALVLGPFLYRQVLREDSTRPETQRTPDASHAIHLASGV
jgi:O-antigen ligase